MDWEREEDLRGEQSVKRRGILLGVVVGLAQQGADLAAAEVGGLGHRLPAWGVGRAWGACG